MLPKNQCPIESLIAQVLVISLVVLAIGSLLITALEGLYP